MDLCLFGRPSLFVEGCEVDIGPNKQRSVLAALAFSPGHHVSIDTVIGRVWGDAAPARAKELVYNYIAGLRARLDFVPGISISGGNGYKAAMDNDSIDVQRFRRLLAEAGSTRADGQTGIREKIQLLRDALGLWQGHPLDGLSGEWFAKMRMSLEIQRKAALVDRFDMELRLGHHRAVLDELVSHYADDPTWEPLAGLLMQALCQTGLQLEALKVFRDTRKALSDSHGVEPGNQLQLLHKGVLSGVAV